MKTQLLALTLWGSLVGASAFGQQVISWNFNDQATALGSGCSRDPGRPGDTDFVSAGNEVSVIFSRLGVELTGYAGGAKLAKKTCRVVVPTRVRAGYYLATLNQTLTYGYERTEGTEGKVNVTSDFYGQAAGNITRDIPTSGADQFSAPSLQAKVGSLWRVNPQWCLRADYVGNYKANITVSGFRQATNKDIVIQIDGHDIRFDAVGVPALCPR